MEDLGRNVTVTMEDMLQDSTEIMTGNWTSLDVITVHPARTLPPATMEAVIGLSVLFCTIGLVGIVGNYLVIHIIVTDRKMRSSTTNLFIMNLACADFLIMVFGIPEIVQFIMNRGWLLGTGHCKLQRYVLVSALYASIMTLVSVCVERFIAIVHPIKVHVFCGRQKSVAAIASIWPVALLCGLPTAIYNQVSRPHPNFPADLCMIVFPGNHKNYYFIFKFSEFTLFFMGPIVVQIALYSVIGKRLFRGTTILHRRQTITDQSGSQTERDSDTIKARKGVVKMLIASVIIYFISYAPVQIPVFYNTFSKVAFKHKWSFLVFVMIMAYINSAANPILYSIFSQNFRQKFNRFLCRCRRRRKAGVRQRQSFTMDSMRSRNNTRWNSLRASVPTGVTSDL